MSVLTARQILAGFTAILVGVAGVPADKAEPNATLKDALDIDSLTTIDVLVAVQDQSWGVEVKDDVLKDLETVGDVVNYIAKARGVKPLADDDNKVSTEEELAAVELVGV